MALDVRGMAPLLQVFDMAASARFYCDLLGFAVVATDGKPMPQTDWMLLERDGVQLMLNTAYDADRRPPAPDPARTRAHRDTALYFGCPDVDAAYRHLVERGLDAKPPRVASYGMKQLYVTDPDGFELCFQWRADR